MSQLFYDGGIFAMTVITVLFVALLIAAWKAPRWVREIGHLALAFAGIMTLVPLHNAAGAVMQAVYTLVRFEPRSIRHRDVLEILRELRGREGAC